MNYTDNILAMLGQANYVWQIGKDRIDWSENFRSLIGFQPDVPIHSAREFETLLSNESLQTRFAALQDSIASNTDGEGGLYHCSYAIHPKFVRGEEPIWIEDTGRWYPDSNGKPDYAEGIVRIVSERRKREETLRRKSEIDELTGLPNRTHLQETLDHYISDGLALGNSSAFVLLSVLDFDHINSIYGFSVGDEVLKRVAELLRGLKRNGDIAARFSGAKFGFIFKNCQAHQVEIAASRMIEKINGNILMTSAGPVALKIAAGACVLPRHAQNAYEAIAAATGALDKARLAFGTKIIVHDPDPREVEARKQNSKLLTRFVTMIESGGFHLAFQPIVGSESHKPIFHEALLRMHNDTEDAIEDAGFLQIAEGLGLMRLLDLKALEQVLDVLETCPDAIISVNVTHDSIADGGWFELLSSRCAAIPDIAERLIVELTESQIVSNIAETKSSIDAIRSLGCKVAIDDFGTGYTSFSHLRDLTVDYVKIDGSFCRELKVDPRNAAFLESMQKLADRFDVQTVVEWVEDNETAVMLKEWGYKGLQGKLFGMPLAILPWERTREIHQDVAKADTAC